MDYKWLSVGYRCFAAVFLFFGRDYRLSESVPVGHWVVLHHFADLRLVRFILDANDCTHLSGIQCVGHHKCEYGAVALRISEKPDRAGNGNQCDGSGDIRGCRSVGSKRHTFDSQLALAVCHQCTAGDYGTAAGYQAFAETGRAVEAEVWLRECDSQCGHVRVTDLYAGRIRASWGDGFPCAAIDHIGHRRNVLRTETADSDDSVAATGLIADTYFPAFDSDVYLFVYRSDGGHGISPVFPSEYVGTQRGHDRIAADSVAVGDSCDSTVGRLSGGTHSSGDIGEYRDGLVCRRTFFTFGAYCRVVRYQYNSSSDALRSRFRVVSDAQ